MKPLKKRLTISLDYDLFEVLDEYSKVAELSKSDIVEAWIREASPQLEILIKMYGTIETASDTQLSEIKCKLERIMGIASEVVDD